MANNPYVKRWTATGSSGAEYIVSMRQDGTYACSCPAWKFAKARPTKEPCKHIRDVRNATSGIIPSGDTLVRKAPNVSDQQSTKPSRDTLPILMAFSPLNLWETCAKAARLAETKNCEVLFTFMGTQVIAEPGERSINIARRWATIRETADAARMAFRSQPRPERPADPPAKPDPVEYMLTAGKRKFRPEVE